MPFGPPGGQNYAYREYISSIRNKDTYLARLMFAGEYPCFVDWDDYWICIILFAPLRPLDSLHPFEAGAEAPDPGAWGGMYFLARKEDAERPRRRYRTRLWVRGLGGIEYSAREVVPGGVPGLWRRGFAARPRPSGRMDWCVLVPRAVASRLHIGPGGWKVMKVIRL